MFNIYGCALCIETENCEKCVMRFPNRKCEMEEWRKTTVSYGDWARREVKLACDKYGKDLSYKTALAAFAYMHDDEFPKRDREAEMKNAVDRLLIGLPLSPIEDFPEDWERPYETSEGKVYESTRLLTLTKTVKEDGSVTYSDTHRFIRNIVGDPNATYDYNGALIQLVDELYPITIPYMPPIKPYILYSHNYLTDRKNGNFDTIDVPYILTPSGELNFVNRYYAFDGDDFSEITFVEFMARMALHAAREVREKGGKKE